MDKKKIIAAIVLILVGVLLYHRHTNISESVVVPASTTTTSTLIEATNASNPRAPSQDSQPAKASRLPTFTEVEGNLKDLFKTVNNLELSKLENGQTIRVSGDLAEVGDNLEKIQQLLSEAASAYGVPKDQLAPATKKSGNDFGTLYISKQYYQGFEVYGGGIQATVNNKSGMAFLIGSYLYPVAEIDLTASMSPEEGVEIMRSHFGATQISVMSPKPSKVVYSMSDPNKAELAYLYKINRMSKGIQFEEVIVGFTSRSVVHKRKTSHN